MSKLLEMKKVLLGIATTATVITSSFGVSTQVFAYAPGCSKEEIEASQTDSEETQETSSSAEEVQQYGISNPQTPEVEAPKQQETQPPVSQVEEKMKPEYIPQTSVVEESQVKEKEPQPSAVETNKPKDTESHQQVDKREKVVDEVYTVKAPTRIYDQNWLINPVDWTYETTPWPDGIATVEGHYGSEAEVQRMYELINEYRIANGKEPLNYNEKMNTVTLGADERAITSANYWEHWSYRFSENIAYTPVFYSDYDDMEMVEKVFNAWIESPGHRNNILNAGQTKNETAISVFYKKVEGGYERYWVQCFR